VENFYMLLKLYLLKYMIVACLVIEAIKFGDFSVI